MGYQIKSKLVEATGLLHTAVFQCMATNLRAEAFFCLDRKKRKDDAKFAYNRLDRLIQEKRKEEGISESATWAVYFLGNTPKPVHLDQKSYLDRKNCWSKFRPVIEFIWEEDLEYD